MTREGISFEIRAGLGRNEWTLLIAYPDRAEPSVSQATGSRDDAIAAAHHRAGTEGNVKGARELFSRNEMKWNLQSKPKPRTARW